MVLPRTGLSPKQKKREARVVSYETSSTRKGSRGGQIRAGIKAASGDVVAVVHADTLVTKTCFHPDPSYPWKTAQYCWRRRGRDF